MSIHDLCLPSWFQYALISSRAILCCSRTLEHTGPYSLYRMPSETGSPAPASPPSNPAPLPHPASITSPKPTSSPAPLLQTKIANLHHTIAHITASLAATLSQLSHKPSIPPSSTSHSAATSSPPPNLSPRTQQQSLLHAQRILDEHVKQLQRYNETKDVAMSLIGIIAEGKGESVRGLLRERGWEGEE